MSAVVNVRSKKVPTLYEADESKYAGPHRWQIRAWARVARRLWRYRAYTRWARQAFSRIEVSGAEHLDSVEGPCVFIANHQSHLDTILVHAVLPEKIRSKIYFGAAQDRWFVKGKRKLVLKPWYQSLALGNFPILRGGGTRALAYASWLLDRGQHVFLFPEGTRATSTEVGEFKHGAAILALEAGVPVVPVYIAGAQKIRPKGTREVARGVGGIEILEPVRFSAGSDVAAATRLLQDRLGEVHARHRGGDRERLPSAA
ncbi:MAG TPA: lysophospholipid acyltransferase family protein [Pseudomonadales bacterium]|jgi:1-acyl-sn-glycerol-3-phosphate acyltransferase